jgi:hypothetical protein
MTPESEQQLIETLKQIRDGQAEVIRLLTAQQAAAEEQVRRSRETVTESISLQRLALQRQRTLTVAAAVGIAGCIAAIAYLVIRYF